MNIVKSFFFNILFRLIDIYLFGAIFIGLCERKKSAVYEIYEWQVFYGIF